MLETNIPEIDVDQVMQQISKDVALITKLPPFQKSADPGDSAAPCPELNEFNSTPDIQSIPLQDKYNLSELLAFHDTEFITCAYRALLHRIPDQEGLHHYLTQLRTGGLTKTEIAGRIRFSAEGKLTGIKVKGLLAPFAIQSSFRIPVLGKISRIIVGIINLPEILKNIQVAENTIFSHQKNTELQTHSTRCQLNLLREYIITSQDQLADKIERHQRQLLDESSNRLIKIISNINLKETDSEESLVDDTMYLAFMDKFRGSRKEIKEKQAIYLPYINRALKQSEVEKILDIGCGRGEWLELLRDNGYKGSGIDMNRVMVEQLKKTGLDVHCTEGLNYLQAQPSHSHAAITGFHIVEHLPLQTLLLLFDECFRVLSPGGVVIFETPNPENLVTGACDFYLDPTHQKPIPPLTLSFLIEARGGRDAQIIRCHPNDNAKTDDATVNSYLFGPRDYSVLAWK